MMRINLLVLSFFLFIAYGHGQSLHFKNYSVEHGLPFVQVYSLSQDSKGNLWIGGYGGLSRFDGTDFTNYSPKNGLANHWVTSTVEDGKGNIWVGTINGLSRFDGESFKTFRLEDGLVGNYITSLSIDGKGQLLIATQNGLSIFDGNKFKNIASAPGFYPSVSSVVYAASDGAIWLSSDSGLCKLTPRGNSSGDNNLEEFDISCGLYPHAVNSITEDRQKNLWLATPEGALRYDGVSFIKYDQEAGLPDNNVLSLVPDYFSDAMWAGTPRGLSRILSNGQVEIVKVDELQNAQKIGKLFNDSEGNLWLGTFNGLYRHRDRAFITYADKDGVKNPFIFPVFRDSKNNLWAGTLEEGYYRFNGRNFKNFTEADGLKGTEMYAGMEDKIGNIWMGTNKGVSIYNGSTFKHLEGIKDGLHGDSVTSIIQDKNGRIWLGGNKGGAVWDKGRLTRFDLTSSSKNFDVWYSFEDSQGTIWLGTYLGGLFRYQPDHELEDPSSFTNFSLAQSWKSETYLAISEDKWGNLYFGSFDGVYIYNKEKGLVDQITEQDGLSSDLIYVMSMDTAGRYLYIGTNQGINRFDVESFHHSGIKELLLFGKEEGLSSIETNSNGIWRDPDNTFWLGTVNGLIHFNPAGLKKNKIESKTSITGIRLFYADTTLRDSTELPYHLNNISFDYVGICLTNPEKVKYKHRLLGLEKEWSPESRNRNARYPNLKPGKYTFEVISCNNEGIWNAEPARFTFIIKPPVWNTWWFRILLAVLILGLAIALLRARAESIRRKESEKLKREIDLAQNELKALRAQMDPHFIFNSLSSIQGFIMNSDEGAALKYLNKFSKLMRRMLSNSERNTVTLKEEIETIGLYLELESMRWEGKFDYGLAVDPGLHPEEFEIPTLLIQPFVENAVIHGVVPKQEGKGMIQVRFSVEGKHLVCTIKDNGVGRKRSMEMKEKSGTTLHESMGMKITGERLELLNKMHNSNMSVEIQDLEEGQETGTFVKVFIPID